MPAVSEVSVAKARLLNILAPYAERFHGEIPKHLYLFESPRGLREACEYALLSGNPKRFRASLTYMVADALGHHQEVDPAAVAVECFHAASLVADDLPCMDNDDERRGMPTCHRAFGEATAILVSFGLHAAAYELLTVNAEIALRRKVSSERVSLVYPAAIRISAQCTGVQGVVGGQYLDVHSDSAHSEESLLRLYDGKTVSLIDLALSLGWLFGGGEPGRLYLMNDFARRLGRLFQLMDDFDDYAELVTGHEEINGVSVLGLDRCKELVEEEMEAAALAYRRTGLPSGPLLSVAECLADLAREAAGRL